MARVKRGVTTHARHKKVLELAKGYRGRASTAYRIALEKVEKGLRYAYRDRRNRKRDFRGLWIQRINAGARELLLKSDDMFVISRPGDEISLSFDARALPPLPAGWTRTFLLYADGFSKEMDINSASPDQLMPLPFHGMSRYPYRWPEHYPLTDEQRRYIEKYNTRVVTSTVPSIETALVRR